MRHTTLRPGVYYGWLIVATTFWMAMCTGSGRSGFGAFVIPMSEELGWNRGTISLAAALGALISGFSQPFVGRLYDQLGGRRLILVCLLVSGLSTALIALTTHLVFLILVFGMALSIAQAGSSLTTTSVLLSKWFHRQRATAMALTTTGSSVGGLLLVPLTASLIGLVGWHLTWGVLGLLVLVLVLPVAFVLLRDDPEETGLRPDGDVPLSDTEQAKPVLPGPLEVAYCGI